MIHRSEILVVILSIPFSQGKVAMTWGEVEIFSTCIYYVNIKPASERINTVLWITV